MTLVVYPKHLRKSQDIRIERIVAVTIDAVANIFCVDVFVFIFLVFFVVCFSLCGSPFRRLTFPGIYF